MLNDRSKKFYPKFLRWECLWSGTRQERVRFLRYTDKTMNYAVIAELNSIREIPGSVPSDTLVRASTVSDHVMSDDDRKQILGGIVAEQKMAKNRRENG